jgi:hypothetical protein
MLMLIQHIVVLPLVLIQENVMAMKTFVRLTLLSALLVPVVASAAPLWYDITFTGADIWTYSADNVADRPIDQSAPRRYRDFTLASSIQATTYGQTGGTASTAPSLGFGAMFGVGGAQHDFAFDSINLWGAGGTAASAWGEGYTSVGNSDAGAEGMSSWKIIQSPTGWSSGIVKGNDSWSADATHAFPVWRSAGTGDMLGIADMNNAAFKFEFQVLADPAFFGPDGKLRVFFGGFRDDLQGAGLDDHEVSGVMNLNATLVPEPASLALTGLALVALVISRRKACG